MDSGKYKFTTKGDANHYTDPEINESRVLGEVVEIIPSFGIDYFTFYVVILTIGVFLIIVGFLLKIRTKSVKSSA